MMKNFYTHTDWKKNNYVAHFGDIDYIIIKEFDFKIYTPYTSSGMLFSITDKEGGEDFYNKWLEYKREFYASK
jgi:hypothetical protein